jgi:hypothetical protein
MFYDLSYVNVYENRPGHWITLALSVNMGMKSASSGTLWQADCSIISRYCGNCSVAEAAWRSASSCKAEFVVAAFRNTSRLSGSGWTCHIQEGALDVEDGSHGVPYCRIWLRWIFAVWTAGGARLCSPSQDCQSCCRNSSICGTGRCQHVKSL